MEEVYTKMCRLMGYVSHEKTNFDALVGKDFKEFISLSSTHCDGWGIATIDHDAHVAHLDRAPETAATSESFSRALAKTSTDGGLLHLRWATAGLSINENNTHPFTYKDYSFIHNGGIFPATGLDDLIDPKFFEFIAGTTDSEKYFYLLLTEIEKHGMVKGISSTIDLIKEHAKFSSINAMIMNEDTFVVVSEFQPEKKPDWAPDDYYEIKYRADSEGVLVASSGWNQPGWITLENHHSLVVDRSTFQTQVITH